MKKFMLPVVALLASGTYAQTYFEDDFSGGIDGWTLVDSDGDGFDWEIIDFASGDGHGNVASSASWDADEGALNPDNWMIAGPIDLTSATGTVALTWAVKGQDPDWADEEYTAYAANGSDPASLMASPYAFNEVVGDTDEDYASRVLDITDLSGESDVYIAFRHHNVSDEFRLNIDDVTVRTLLDNDIQMISVTTAPVVEAGAVEITGVVKNNGGTEITSFELDWNDGTSHNETISATIPIGGTYEFTHPTSLDAAAGNVYSMTVCAILDGDADNTNDCVDAAVSAVSTIPAKYVVGEEKTGTWCGWCPRGTVALQEMESEEKFIGIAVHNGDPMVVSAYDSGINTYIPGGYPGGGVDRIIEGDPSSFASMYDERSSHIPPASIFVEAADMGDNIEVHVIGWFIGELTGDYRLAAVITEDGVTGSASGYAQANYYSGGGAGELTGPDGFEWHSAPNPVPASDMVYDHVARALGDNQILGTSGSLPATVAANTYESYTYTIPKGADWDLNNLHFIGMLVNGSTGEILNAGKTDALSAVGIEENEAEFNLSVYPNPSSDLTYVKVSLIETSDVLVEVYNAIGELVYVENTQNLTSGDYIYNIDVNGFASGMYTIRTTVNNAVKTAKLSVQ